MATENFDSGYNRMYRKETINDEIVDKKIEFYTSRGVGSQIRDAETGQYYKYLVGSKEEALFFSGVISTHECKNKNGMNLLFFKSPERYASHFLNNRVNNRVVDKWNTKRDQVIFEMK